MDTLKKVKGILKGKMVIGEFNMQIARSNIVELTFKGMERQSVSRNSKPKGVKL